MSAIAKIMATRDCHAEKQITKLLRYNYICFGYIFQVVTMSLTVQYSISHLVENCTEEIKRG